MSLIENFLNLKNDNREKTRINTLNDNNIEKFLGRMSPQNQNDDQPLYFGFSL